MAPKQEQPFQSEFVTHWWRSPDRQIEVAFPRLALGYEVDALPGVVIVTDAGCVHAKAFVDKNLRAELPSLLTAASHPVVYWLVRQDQVEREALLAKLTDQPVFVG